MGLEDLDERANWIAKGLSFQWNAAVIGYQTRRRTLQ